MLCRCPFPGAVGKFNIACLLYLLRFSIPPSAALKFNRIMAENYIPHEFEQCPAPLRHKSYFINPRLLTENNVPYNVVCILSFMYNLLIY
jgi:hypothetical protein